MVLRFANSFGETLQPCHLTFQHRLVSNIIRPIFQNKSLCRAPFRTQSNICGADCMEIFIPGRISQSVLSNSFRSSRPELSYKKVRKILQNSKENTCLRVCNFFELLDYKKVGAKHKFVNGYSATKRAHLQCK